ncbi:unnamed protein product [Withania somnifera]
MAPKPKEKAKASAATPAISIEDLFTSLNCHIQRSEYEQAVKVSDQILAAAPRDEDAIRCKVVALVKADSIEEALDAIKKCSKKASLDLSFFKACCLYRQNKLEAALEYLKGQEGSTESMLLESQILYHLEKMGASINLVDGLVSEGALDSLKVKATSSFEMAYNTACSLIEREEYKDVEQLLLSARRIDQETLIEENLADDDVETELAPIAVQIAYVQQILGNTQEAVASYTDPVKRNLADESSLAGPKDVSDGLRKLDKLIEKRDGPEKFQLARGLDLKLSQKQGEAISTNRVLLLLHSNKMDQARELFGALPGIFPDNLMPVLLQAAVHVRENKAAKAEEILGQYADKFPHRSKVILLARAQVAAAAGHPQIAANSLAKIPDIQHKPASFATIVSLKERAGVTDGADAVFDSAITWWSNAMTEDNKVNTIMQEAASFKLRHGRKEEATFVALVGLIQTAAHGDIEKAEAYEKQLKPLPGLKAIDISILEKTGASIVRIRGRKRGRECQNIQKGFDPANPGPPPDPERWLPKRERSSYRPKRKDKRAAQIRGSQGAVAKEATSSSDTKLNQPTNPKGVSECRHCAIKGFIQIFKEVIPQITDVSLLLFPWIPFARFF